MIGRSMLARGVRTPRRQTRNLRKSADLGADLEALGLDLCEQPVDLERVQQTGAEVLDRLRAAGHPVAQALDRRATAVAGRHVAGEERVARADARPGLLLLHAHAVQSRRAVLEHLRVAAVG